MANRTPQIEKTEDEEIFIETEEMERYRFAERLSRLESSVKIMDYRTKKEIPHNLSDRIIILEQKFESEIGTLKKDLTDVKVTMKERLAFISIIVALIIALASLIIRRA